MSNRRQFLGTLGKALGASGLLLPWAGKGALAIPDLGKAASLPVAAAKLPLSREALLLRNIRRQLHDLRGKEHSKARSEEWRALVVDHYRPVAARVAEREEPTFADCVELAEIIWRGLAKEEREQSDGDDWSYLVPTGALSIAAGDTRMAGSGFTSSAYWCREAIVALVEAVLTLGDGERFDPNTAQGHWPQKVRANKTPKPFSWDVARSRQ